MRAYDHSGATGTLLGGRYRVLARLDAGGMGAVYDGLDTRLGRPVAVKLLHPHVADDQEYLARFRREALVTAELRHPNIVQLFDFALPEDGPPFIVMERLDGAPLSRRVRTHGPLPVERAISIALQVLAAVEVTHAAGVTHRDLKPQNVFLVPLSGDTDLVKVLDFGVASVKSGPGFERLTRTGLVLGTPATMAPEQALGEPTDARADLYACGVVLYFMLAGTLPFSGPDVGVVLRAVIKDPPPPLQKVRPEVGDGLAELVHRALRKSPAERWQTATEMVRALRALPTSTGAGHVCRPPPSSDAALAPTEASPMVTRRQRPSPGGGAAPVIATASGGATAPDAVHPTRSSARVDPSQPTTVPQTQATSQPARRRSATAAMLGLGALAALVVAAGIGGGWLAYRAWIAPGAEPAPPRVTAPSAPVAVATTHEATPVGLGDASTSRADAGARSPALPLEVARHPTERPQRIENGRHTRGAPRTVASEPRDTPPQDDSDDASGSVTLEEVFDARAPQAQVRRRLRQLASGVAACAPPNGLRGSCGLWLDIDPRGQSELYTFSSCRPASVGTALDCAAAALSRGGFPRLDTTYRVRVRVAWQ